MSCEALDNPASAQRSCLGSKGMGRSVGISTSRRERSAASRFCAQALADLALDLVRALESASRVPCSVIHFLRGHLPDSGNARDVVDAVSHQGEDVATRRRDAEELLDPFSSKKASWPV